MARRKPSLHEVHTERGAKFTEFGGWDMPVAFDSIRDEHEAVRTTAGIFDVSHMGEIEVSGPDAEALMQRLTTNDVSRLSPGQAQYAAITNEAGVILDDTVVYRLPEEGSDADDGLAGDRDGEATYLFIPNAGHDGRMEERWAAHRDEWGLDAAVENATDEYAMLALQGPAAADALADALTDETGADGTDADDIDADETDPDLHGLGRFEADYAELADVTCLVARTGYTGEDGFELLCPWDEAESVWSAFDVQPCGLGARDTLRIEAGFLLSGQDFDPDSNPRNPYEAGVGFVAKLDTEFVGRDALEQVEAEGVEERLVGFRLLDRGVPRHGYDIVADTADNADDVADADPADIVVGIVTSGTMSPTLDHPIGMGYVPVEYADPDTALGVVVRGQRKRARVESLPFYERA